MTRNQVNTAPAHILFEAIVPGAWTLSSSGKQDQVRFARFIYSENRAPLSSSTYLQSTCTRHYQISMQRLRGRAVKI